MPPIKQSMIASMTNCIRIVRRFAPSAIRTPISLVRSVIDTSMIFMTPTPPTISEIAAIPDTAIVMTLSTVLIMPMLDCMLLAVTWKFVLF